MLRTVAVRSAFDFFDYLRLLRLSGRLDSSLTSTAKKECSMAQSALATTLPSEDESLLAKETSRVLASHLHESDPMRLDIVEGSKPAGTLTLPASAVRLLVRILEEMARGNAVTVIPVHAELTTQEAADLLNISRPSFIQLLDEGKIEFRRIGTHRRVRFEALMAHKRQIEAERRAALAELAAYDQELGI
jgi:excisionase family DNA binding protein